MAARHEFVYLILSHGTAPGLGRLIHTLKAGSPNAAIVVHHDLRSPLPAILQEVDTPGLYVLTPRMEVRWGEYSLLAAILAGLRFCQEKIDFAWLTLLSAQDYPIQPIARIEAELRHSPFDGFTDAAPAANGPYAHRYFMQYRQIPTLPYQHRLPQRLREFARALCETTNRSQSKVRIVSGSPAYIGLASSQHPFRPDFECYKGSAWFAINKKAAGKVLAACEAQPALLAWYRRTHIPDESCIQTILLNAADLNVCRDDRRFIKWTKPYRSHPDILTIKDLEDILQSSKHFCRKIDEDIDPRLPDALDRVIFG